jgi:hypothetical protein
VRVRGTGLFAIILLSLGLTGVASAQGLGDTAARERERRAKDEKEQKEKKPEAAHVYTNEDLEKGRPPGEKTSSSGSTSGTASSGSSTSSEGSSEESSEGSAGPPPLPDMAGADRPYINAVREAQAQVVAIEKQIEQVSGKLNPMSTEYIYGPSGSNSASEELQVRQELSELQARLTQARQDLAAANQALSNARQGRPAEPVER